MFPWGALLQSGWEIRALSRNGNITVCIQMTGGHWWEATVLENLFKNSFISIDWTLKCFWVGDRHTKSSSQVGGLPWKVAQCLFVPVYSSVQEEVRWLNYSGPLQGAGPSIAVDLSLASLRQAVRGGLLFGQGLIDPLLTAFAIGLWGRPQGESGLLGHAARTLDPSALYLIRCICWITNVNVVLCKLFTI